MLYVSLFVEILRLRPRLVFWVVTLTQAAIWALVPSIFFSFPPGNLLEVLAIGRDAGFTPDVGPPLGYWAADAAFRLARNHVAGVYVLAQLCVVATYWAVFKLASALVGERQAMLTILLMAGISALSAATPDYTPALLAMPLWALGVLLFLRASATENSRWWFVLAADLSLLMLTSYLSVILVGLLAIFALIKPEIRQRLLSPCALGAIFVVICVSLVPISLLKQHFVEALPRISNLRNVETLNQNIVGWLRLVGVVVFSHFGFAILAALAANAIWIRHDSAPVMEGRETTPIERALILFVAIAPPIVVTSAAAIIGYAGVINPAPLVTFSALALVIAAGPNITLHNQRIISWAWAALLFVPPLLVSIFVTTAPLVGLDLRVAQPASAVGRFFADTFERRTGKPLAYVGGDQNLALMIGVGAPNRPRVIGDKPGFPKPAAAEIAEKGAIIVWPATDQAGTPPPDIKARYPDLTPDVPRAFDRSIQVWRPLLRIGWGLIRPANAPAQ